MHKENILSKIPGQKVRRQFFNLPIYICLSVENALLSAWTAIAIQDTETTFSYWFEISAFLLLLCAGLVLPLALLSLLNRFCFGKIICVLDDKGLYHDGGFVDWRHIKKAVYEPDIPSKVGSRFYSCCNQLCLTVKPFQKEILIELDHAPFLLLRKIKQNCPGIPCKMSGWGIAVVLSLSLGLGILSALCVLAEYAT